MVDNLAKPASQTGRNPEFQLGLVMAGAISAGAYSAEVMDFIIEALDAYEAAKAKEGWDGPTHDVRVPVLAGASAGGMTSAIVALHAFHDLVHVWPDRPLPPPKANRLYSSWVTDISIERLLDTTDLGKHGSPHVKSALCCNVLTEIVNDAFKLSGQRKRAWIGCGDDHSLAVLLTVTNMRGVPYSFSVFGADANERYGMLNHGDYFEFKVGTPPPPARHALDVRNATGPEWDLFRTTALATGAFPIGLAPRRLQRSPEDYRDAKRVGFDDPVEGTFKSIPPDDGIYAAKPYQFISVDGGTIDNEPLELGRRYLAGGAGHNPRDGALANKAIVLIAPFPNFVHLPEEDPNDDLVHIIPQLATMLVDQARFKPDELAVAQDDKVFSQFIISPVRPADGNPHAVKYPIASGVLNGFGGFLHESFRHHDYLLGRRNAQAFLRWNFSLPETNPLFDGFRRDPRSNVEKWYVRNVGTVPAGASLALGDDRMRPRSSTLLRYKNIAIRRDCQSFLSRRNSVNLLKLARQTCRSPTTSRALICTSGSGAGPRWSSLRWSMLISVSPRRNSWIGPVLRFGARRFGTEMAAKKATSVVIQAIEEVAAAFPPSG